MIRIFLFQHVLHRIRDFGQAAAFDGFHDDDAFSVPADHIVAGTGLYKLRVPVQIVCCNLNKLEFRMLSQNAVEQLCGGVEREAQVADLAFCLPFQRMFNQMFGLNDAAISIVAVIPTGLKIVEQIVVNIVYAELIQLMLEVPFDLILVTGFQKESGELGSDTDALSRVTLHHRFADGFLTFAFVINVRRIKVIVPGLQVSVHHLVELLIVKVCGISVYDRQTHHAETKH